MKYLLLLILTAASCSTKEIRPEEYINLVERDGKTIVLMHPEVYGRAMCPQPEVSGIWQMLGNGIAQLGLGYWVGRAD